KGVTEELRKGYAGFTVKASACTDCGLCEERCPYDVAIMDKMHRAMALYGS
ncbi:MAG: 4Fe-4S binding protein, partial [Chloroflexi bacterium]|nr:4Fe-4S binding protein [Chloroflexota bacterium]